MKFIQIIFPFILLVLWCSGCPLGKDFDAITLIEDSVQDTVKDTEPEEDSTEETAEDISELPEIVEARCNNGLCECPPDLFVFDDMCGGELKSVANINELEGFLTGYQNVSIVRKDEDSYIGTTILVDYFYDKIKAVSFDFSTEDDSFEVRESGEMVFDDLQAFMVGSATTKIVGTVVYSVFSDYYHGTFAIVSEEDETGIFPLLELSEDCEGNEETLNYCISEVQELTSYNYYLAHSLGYDGVVITTNALAPDSECERTPDGWEGCVAWIKSTDFIEDESLPVNQILEIVQDDDTYMFLANHGYALTVSEVDWEPLSINVTHVFTNYEEGYLVSKIEYDPDLDLFYVLGRGQNCVGEEEPVCEIEGTVFQILEYSATTGFTAKGKIMLADYYPLSSLMINKIQTGPGTEPPSTLVSFVATHLDSLESGDINGGIWVVDISHIDHPKTTVNPSYKMDVIQPVYAYFLSIFVTSVIDDMLFVPWDFAIIALRMKLPPPPPPPQP